jgi:hypothetical protein
MSEESSQKHSVSRRAFIAGAAVDENDHGNGFCGKSVAVGVRPERQHQIRYQVESVA